MGDLGILAEVRGLATSLDTARLRGKTLELLQRLLRFRSYSDELNNNCVFDLFYVLQRVSSGCGFANGTDRIGPLSARNSCGAEVPEAGREGSERDRSSEYLPEYTDTQVA